MGTFTKHEIEYLESNLDTMKEGYSEASEELVEVAKQNMVS
jgi:hypothetical protein